MKPTPSDKLEEDMKKYELKDDYLVWIKEMEEEYFEDWEIEEMYKEQCEYYFDLQNRRD